MTWENEEFEILDPKGMKLDVILEAGCPTVDLPTARRLIQELEDQEIELDRRVRALRAGDPGDLSPKYLEVVGGSSESCGQRSLMSCWRESCPRVSGQESRFPSTGINGRGC